jgi:hypothetical protein
MSIYSWQEPYLESLLETEKSKRHARILETHAALEQRLLSPVGDEELRAMGAAVATLDLLEGQPRDVTAHISESRSERDRKNLRRRDLNV